MDRIALLLTIFILSFSSVFAADDEKWYQVEIIVFARTHDANFAEERWTYTETVLAPAAKSLIPPDLNSIQASGNVAPFQRFVAENFVLNTVERKLDDKEHYRVILHTAWKQPLKSGGDVVAARLDSRSIAQENYDLANNLPPELVEVVKPIDLPKPSDIPILNGNISIKLSKYLHFAFDLYYKPNDESKFIPWSDSRKIKLNEVNYYDHPLVGIIARVTPTKP